MTGRWTKSAGRTLAIVATLGIGGLLLADAADARSGAGGSFGSRGSRTFSAPSTTPTAPRAAAPIQKSITQPGVPGARAATPSRFGGLRGLLFGGLIGAGLAGLFGFGGGFAAFLGFILQTALIAWLAMLAWNYFSNRNGRPATAQANAGGARPGPANANAYRTAANLSGGSGAPAPALAGDDFNAFERLLKEVQLAYANGDVKALGDRVTPEVLSQFSHELEDNRRRGLSNDLSEPKLLKGDLSEAWRENGADYATVAMRYEIIDAMVEQKTGRVVKGSTTEPQEVVELWTFVRPAGSRPDRWELSAIQQAA